MSTTPPEQPAPPPSSTAYRYGHGQIGGDIFARLPVPGNAELVIWGFILLLLGFIALLTDNYNIEGWIRSVEILTVAYLISRGIAKASRVLEH